jgi:hypothetical protein
MAWNDAVVNPAGLVNRSKGVTAMFGMDYLSRQARKWIRDRERRSLEATMLDLPLELQKDIGWPAPQSPRSAGGLGREHRSPHIW